MYKILFFEEKQIADYDEERKNFVYYKGYTTATLTLVDEDEFKLIRIDDVNLTDVYHIISNCKKNLSAEVVFRLADIINDTDNETRKRLYGIISDLLYSDDISEEERELYVNEFTLRKYELEKLLRLIYK